MGGGGDDIWTWILIGGGRGFFWDSFSIFGQDLKTYHHVMLNLSFPRMPTIDGTLGFFYFKKNSKAKMINEKKNGTHPKN